MQRLFLTLALSLSTSTVAVTAAFAHPSRAAQPFVCGTFKGAPWTVGVRTATGISVRHGDTYYVSRGYALISCDYAKMRAAQLTHLLATQLRSTNFPRLHLSCSARPSADAAWVKGGAMFGQCQRSPKQYDDPTWVGFFWSPTGDFVQ